MTTPMKINPGKRGNDCQVSNVVLDMKSTVESKSNRLLFFDAFTATTPDLVRSANDYV
jgi:hypothetical protein